MNADQFDALAALIKLRASPSREAARLVMVAGLPPSEAARQASISPQAVSNVLATCRWGIELAAQVTSPNPAAR